MTITIVRGITGDDQVAASSITGTLPVANGGTGATSLTGILLGNGTSAVSAITTSAGIAGAISDETGSGALVFADTPTLIAPLLGTPTSGVMTNVTGTAAGLTAGNATLAATATVATNLFNTVAATVTDSTGRITYPAQPRFSAQVTSNTGAVTGDGTVYTIIPSSAAVNVGSSLNLSTGVFTAPVTGFYSLSMTVLLSQAGAVGHTSATCSIVCNSVVRSICFVSPTATSPNANEILICGTTDALLAANQTVSFTVTVAGGAKTVLIEGNVAGITQISGYLIG